MLNKVSFKLTAVDGTPGQNPGQNDPLEFADLLSKDPRINSSLSRVAQNAVECEKRN